MNLPNRSQEKSLPDGADLHLPWHLKLPDQLESAFQNYFLTLSRRLIRSSFYIVLALLLSGSAMEFLIDPDSALLGWRARLIAVMAASAAWWASQPRSPENLLQPAVSLTAIIIALSNNYLGASIEHSLSYSYYLFNLLAILLMGSLFRITLRWALATSVIIFILMLLSMIFASPLSTNEILVLSFFVLSGGILSLYGQYNFERLQRKHFIAERVLAMHRHELHSANMILENQVSEDPLTGTVNRRGLEVRLSGLLHQKRYQGTSDSGQIFALLFDIDFFKQYNDTYGHLAGDECLRHIASVPRSMIQSDTDFIARYGGEEFLVILNGIKLNDALVFAERMRDRIEKKGMAHSSSRVSNVVTISVGVAGWRPGIEKTADLIQHADEALYEAKKLGRNRVVLLDQDGTLRPM